MRHPSTKPLSVKRAQLAKLQTAIAAEEAKLAAKAIGRWGRCPCCGSHNVGFLSICARSSKVKEACNDCETIYSPGTMADLEA